jgi:hypothetical protein
VLKAEPEERSVLSSEELAALERAALDVVGETVVARVPDGPVNSQRSKRTLCFLRPGAREPEHRAFQVVKCSTSLGHATRERSPVIPPTTHFDDMGLQARVCCLPSKQKAQLLPTPTPVRCALPNG